jgi:hypothetical protein
MPLGNRCFASMRSAFLVKMAHSLARGRKIRRLQELASANGLNGVFAPLADIWDRNLRNAAFHADYSVAGDSLRIRNPPTRYSWERFDTSVNGALAYYAAPSMPHQKVHVGSYIEPIAIPVHPEFSRDPDERAVVIVREGYGCHRLERRIDCRGAQAGKDQPSDRTFH